MSCTKFEACLDRFAENALTDEELRIVEQHLQECGKCSRLAAVIRGDLNLLEPAAGKLLTESILDQTTGSACRKVKSLLAACPEGQWEPQVFSRVEQHLEFCPPCAALVAVLKEMETVLPSLAVLKPDTDFVDQVIRRTTARKLVRKTREPAWAKRLGGWWEWCLARPRFSWEAAYVGTLIVVLVFGVSGVSFQNVVARPLSTVESELAPKLEATSDVFRAGWQKTGERTDRFADSLRNEWVARRQAAEESFERLQVKVTEVGASLVDAALLVGSKIQTALDGTDGAAEELTEPTI
jgi:anti-sigma factor RsiW